jgi:hypothetical protein
MPELEEQDQETRAAQYRERASELRRLAAQTRYDDIRRQLRSLAEQFEALAATVDRVTVAA